MFRPWHVWLSFAACAILVAAAVGWLSIKALQADANEATAREQSFLEENTRLALWRMESLVAPLVAQESARPYFVYDALYAPDRAYARMFNTISNVDVPARVPSPLLTTAVPSVKLHFQIDPTGAITSPQVPMGRMRDEAVPRLVSADHVAEAEALLQRFTKEEGGEQLLAKLPPPDPIGASAMAASRGFGELPGQRLPQGGLLTDEQQFARNRSEYEARSRYVQQQTIALNDNINPAYQQGVIDGDGASTGRVQGTPAGSSPIVGEQTRVQPDSPSEIFVSMMTPLWYAGDVVLARRVEVGGRSYIQGCLLDWRGIEAQLLDAVADLLPNADVVPYVGTPPVSEESERDVTLLASLPVRLIPGSVPIASAAVPTPVQTALLVGWAALAVAAGAAVGLLQGVMSLSERRAAFVSAVTHELRTPLTTFRMYSEMLAQGMVRDEGDRQRYLETLRIEADRLTHLVANVLAYARLERGRPGGRIERLSVDGLLKVATQRLADRAAEAGLALRIDAPEEARVVDVLSDPSIVEQILFNLVDNACKYGASASDKSLTLSTVHDEKIVTMRVCDRGPGISPREQKRLFQPFRKSACEAAVTAPGVGLGLALSRRLAREMGGDLLYEPGPAGTCFALRLPRA